MSLSNTNFFNVLHVGKSMKMKLDSAYQLEYSNRDLSHFEELEIQRYHEDRPSNFD